MAKALNKILVPLDGSKTSLRGLKFALMVAKQSGSSIIGLNVIPSLKFTNTASMNGKMKQKGQKILNHAKVLSQSSKVPFLGTIKISNNVGREIIAFAESHKADMIIIGSRGPDPEIEMFLGSVANHVVNKSKIPVTVVK